METLIKIVHIGTCFLLVVVVLMQSGKGAELSATLGGSSQTVFGSTGGANFFQKLTYALAGVFMLTSLALTIAGSKGQKSVFDNAPAAATAPAAPGANAPVPDAPKGATAGSNAAPAAPAAPEASKQ